MDNGSRREIKWQNNSYKIVGCIL